MRLLIILLLAAVLSGFIAACGEDGSTSPGQSEPSLAAQQTAEQPERQAQQAAQPEPVQSEAETVSESEAQPEAQAAPDESTETEAQPDEQTQPRVRVGRMVDPDRWGSLMVGGQRPGDVVPAGRDRAVGTAASGDLAAWLRQQLVGGGPVLRFRGNS